MFWDLLAGIWNVRLESGREMPLAHAAQGHELAVDGGVHLLVPGRVQAAVGDLFVVRERGVLGHRCHQSVDAGVAWRLDAQGALENGHQADHGVRGVALEVADVDDAQVGCCHQVDELAAFQHVDLGEGAHRVRLAR